MNTITIVSEYESVFDVFGLELITACGVVHYTGVYVNRQRAESMAQWFRAHGWLTTKDNIRYEVYKVNIVELIVFV